MSSLRQFFASMEEKMDPVWRREIQLQFDANSLMRRILPGMVMVIGLVTIVVLNGPSLLPSTDDQSRSALYFTVAGLSGLLAFMSILSIQSKKHQGWFIPEKDSKALFFLLSTPISSAEVVLSKLIPAWWDSVLVLLLPMPLMVVGTAFGFWSPAAVVLLYLVAILTLFGVRLSELQASIHTKEIKAMRGKRPIDGSFFPLVFIVAGNAWQLIASSNPSLASTLSAVWDQTWVQDCRGFVLDQYLGTADSSAIGGGCRVACTVRSAGGHACDRDRLSARFHGLDSSPSNHVASTSRDQSDAG